MKDFVEASIEQNGKPQTVRIEKRRYEQIHKQVVAACKASIVLINDEPYTTEIVRLDKIFTDEIELAVGYQIADQLLAEFESPDPEETD